MHRFFLGLSKAMAIAGGFVLSLLVAIIVISILGREANGFLHGDFMQANMKGFADWLLAIQLPGIWGPIKIGPVTGDYELVEAGMAFTIFAFLPLAQITGSHASVDIFTSWLPDRSERVLTMLIDLLFAIVLVIIAIQLWEGMAAKQHRHQITLLLQFPVWWGYAVSMVGAAIAATVSVYMALVRIYEVVTGHHIVPAAEGAEH